MLHRVVLALSLLFLPCVAHAQFSSDFSNDFGKVAVYLKTAEFAAALKLANEYAALPRCAPSQKPPCSKQLVINQIIVAANKADADIRTAQQFALNNADKKTAEKAANDANTSVTAFIKLVPAR